MLLDANTGAFTLAALLVTLTPGNDTVLTLKNAISGGARDGVFTALGVGSGLFVHAMLSALGLSVILLASAELFMAVKLIGAAYVVWLGMKSLLAAFKGGAGLAPHPAGNGGPMHCSSRRGKFAEGFWCNVLNPKVAVFYLAFLPQFITPGDPVALKSVLLAGIHYVMGISWLALLSVGVGRARRFVTRPGFQRTVDGLCGTILIALGLRLAVR